MAAQPLAVKLRCTSWGQVATLHERDLSRGKLYLRTGAVVTLGRDVRIEIVLPSGTVAHIEGRVEQIVAPGEATGPGMHLVLTKLPPSSMYLIESALLAAAAPPAVDDNVFVDEVQTAAAERELLNALEEELRALRAMNPFQILGVSYECDDAAVRTAFLALSKKYHPDRFARFETERGRALAAELFVTIRDAYRRVVDANARATARSQIRKGPLRGEATPVFGVPVMRTRPPAAGSIDRRATLRPGSLPAPDPRLMRGRTPIQGLPIPAAMPSSRPEPLDGGLGTREPAAPQAIEPEESARPTVASPPVLTRATHARSDHTRQTPAVPPPPTRPASGSAAPGSGLNADDLFRDLDPPADEVQAAAPLTLDEHLSTRAAQELVLLGRFDEAMVIYDEHLRANPTDRPARAGRELAFGLKLIAAGDRAGAAQHFEAALEIEPWSERAARELNDLRRSTTDDRKGVLSKLLGKGMPS